MDRRSFQGVPDAMLEELGARGTDPNLGELVLDYRISRLIKAGPNGRIYAARSVFSGHPVAIKLLRPVLCDRPGALAAFQREQWFLREAGCRSIPRFLGAGGFRGVPWYAMDRLPGGSLLELLEERRLDSFEITRLFHRISRATEELHAIGLSHGPLCAAGLIVSDDLHQVSLLDVAHAEPIVSEDQMLADLTAVGALFERVTDRLDEGTRRVVSRCSSHPPRIDRASDLSAELETVLTAMSGLRSTPRLGLDAVTALDLRFDTDRVAAGEAWMAAEEEVTEVLQRS